jgi:6-phosphogluconolactonase (cycloisomerase 2 family)
MWERCRILSLVLTLGPTLLVVSCARERGPRGVAPEADAATVGDAPTSASLDGPSPVDRSLLDAAVELTADVAVAADVVAREAAVARDAAVDLPAATSDGALSPDLGGPEAGEAGVPPGHETIYVSNGTYGDTITILTLDPGTGRLTQRSVREGVGQNVTTMAVTADERALWVTNLYNPSGPELRTFAIDRTNPLHLTPINAVSTLSAAGPPCFMPDGRWFVAPGKRSIWGEFVVVPVLSDTGAGPPTRLDGYMIDLPPIGLVLPVPSGKEILAVVRPSEGPINEVGGPVLRLTFDGASGKLALVPGEALAGKYWSLLFHPTLSMVYAGGDGKLVAATYDGQRGLVNPTEHVWSAAYALHGPVGPMAIAPSGRFVVGQQRIDGRLLAWRLDAAGQPSPASTAIADGTWEARIWSHVIFDPSSRFLLVTGTKAVFCFELGDDGQLTLRSQVPVDQPLFLAAVSGV